MWRSRSSNYTNVQQPTQSGGHQRASLRIPTVQERMAAELPADKLEQARQQFQNVEFTEDAILLTTPVGKITFRVVEREEPKLVKMGSEGSPIPLDNLDSDAPNGMLTPANSASP